jgi:sterol 3beta-glucosyltransferase
MKILLISLGTRGDIEPFLAQAERLSARKHEIACLFPEQFRDLVEGLGYKFFGLDKRFLDLLSSNSGKSVIAGDGGFLKKVWSYFQLIKASFKIQANLVSEQKDTIDSFQPDRVLFHIKAMYCTLAAMASPEKYILLSPIPCLVHPHQDYPQLGLSKWKPFSKKWNLKSYGWVNAMRYKTFNKFLKSHYSDFPEMDFSIEAIKNFELNQLQTIYQISPTLFPKPTYWPKTAHVTGYLDRNQSKDYTPDPQLLNWLDKYPKAILLTFGSMTNPKPGKYSEIIIGILEKHQIPAIVNLSWGGLEKINESSDRIYYVNQIPYDWILPKLYGMIHHGGSGTIHSGAKYGVVQLIVPHIMDQYFWNRLVEKKRLGPLGTSIHNFNQSKFEHALIDFWNNPEYKKQTFQIAHEMKREEDYEKILQIIETDSDENPN